MPRFFLDNIVGPTVTLGGEDAKHVIRSLRMKKDAEITLCDQQGWDYITKIIEMDTDKVFLEIVEKAPNTTETKVKITLYQALPKGDKLEFIVQKAVELGAVEIVPVLTQRCISRPKDKAMAGKIQRLERISLEAAKQSQRGIVPVIRELVTFQQAVEEMTRFSLPILLYENAVVPLRDIVDKQRGEIAVMVGSEGGFSPEEVELAISKNIDIISLGSRILRCETAPICILSALGYATGEF